MPYDDYVGRTYGPVTYSTARAVCDRYVAATGDDPDRWSQAAPSAIAGAMLFAIAPLLLDDPDLAEITTSVIHGEQTFGWARPIPIDAELSLTGEITRLRERGGVFFVGFEVEASDEAGVVVTGSSMFLMSGGAASTGEVVEETEPAATDGSALDVAGVEDPPAAEGAIATLERAASRADLVRYAGASQDFNPIHWDHDAAVAAGLPGVVVHGLMQSAWLCQSVERHGADLGSARFRYRAPLRPASPVRVEGTRTEGGWGVRLVGEEGTEHVAATFSDRA